VLIKKLKDKIQIAIRIFFNSDKLYYQSSVAAIKSQRSYYDKIKDLRQAELKVFSQNGEDGILDFLIERIAIQKPTMLEIGSGNFFECNSRFLNHLRNSSVYLVDANIDELTFKKNFRQRIVNSSIFLSEIWVSKENIRNVVDDAVKLLGTINILSVDLDGNDYWIVEAMGTMNLDIIIVEYNPILSVVEPVSTIYDPNFNRADKHYSFKYYGASLESFIEYFKINGFIFVGTTSQGTNAFFVNMKYSAIFSGLGKDSNVYKNISSHESRDETGELSFIDSHSERNLIGDLKVINTVTQQIKYISETF
jgi:hypothetical protein